VAGVIGVILLASGNKESAQRQPGVRPYAGLDSAGLTGNF
jgi:hypothetical protein